MSGSKRFLVAGLFLMAGFAHAETMMDEGVWTAGDLKLLETGSLVITDESLVADGVYYPKESILRVIDVRSNQPGWSAGKHSFEQLPLGFKATVTLGPKSESSSRRLISFRCEKNVGQAGAYSRAQVERFDCTLGFREVLEKGTPIYNGR